MSLGPEKLKVLVTGGSGYLGQFLIAELQKLHEVTYTYHSRPMPAGMFNAAAVQLDLTRDGCLAECIAARGPFDVVVNTAALSAPRTCQDNPMMARALNVPTVLLAALEQQRADSGVEALVIHLSTDQVYDGSKADWTEACETRPVNVYGQTKVAAEALLRERWPRHVSLRASLILGPPPPAAVPQTLFLDWIHSALQQGKPTSFFEDQFRCPIFVRDIARIVAHLIANPSKLQACQVLNMGGPERLNRVQMAQCVAAHCGLDESCIAAVHSSTVAMAVASPADISMDCSKLAAMLPFKLTPFAEVLRQSIPVTQPAPTVAGGDASS